MWKRYEVCFCQYYIKNKKNRYCFTLPYLGIEELSFFIYPGHQVLVQNTWNHQVLHCLGGNCSKQNRMFIQSYKKTRNLVHPMDLASRIALYEYFQRNITKVICKWCAQSVTTTEEQTQILKGVLFCCNFFSYMQSETTLQKVLIKINWHFWHTAFTLVSMDNKPALCRFPLANCRLKRQYSNICFSGHTLLEYCWVS